jgi:hypothetical protein
LVLLRTSFGELFTCVAVNSFEKSGIPLLTQPSNACSVVHIPVLGISLYEDVGLICLKAFEKQIKIQI